MRHRMHILDGRSWVTGDCLGKLLIFIQTQQSFTSLEQHTYLHLNKVLYCTSTSDKVKGVGRWIFKCLMNWISHWSDIEKESPSLLLFLIAISFGLCLPLETQWTGTSHPSHHSTKAKSCAHCVFRFYLQLVFQQNTFYFRTQESFICHYVATQWNYGETEREKEHFKDSNVKVKVTNTKNIWLRVLQEIIIPNLVILFKAVLFEILHNAS